MGRSCAAVRGKLGAMLALDGFNLLRLVKDPGSIGVVYGCGAVQSSDGVVNDDAKDAAGSLKSVETNLGTTFELYGCGNDDNNVTIG
jgi:hypothetical protein